MYCVTSQSYNILYTYSAKTLVKHRPYLPRVIQNSVVTQAWLKGRIQNDRIELNLEFINEKRFNSQCYYI